MKSNRKATRPDNYARHRKLKDDQGRYLEVLFAGSPDLRILGGCADDWAVQKLRPTDPQGFWLIGEDSDQRSLRRLRPLVTGDKYDFVVSCINAEKNLNRPLTKDERKKIDQMARELL